MRCCSIPLKQWKCSFEETLQLQCISDWLQEIAAIFAESKCFQQIHIYITAQPDTVQNVCDETSALQQMSSDSGKATSVTCMTDMSTSRHDTTMENHAHLVTNNLQLSADNNSIDNSMSLNDSTALNKDHSKLVDGKQPRLVSRRKKTPELTSKQAVTRRRTRKSKSMLSDDTVDSTPNSKPAGNTSTGNAYCCFSL